MVEAMQDGLVVGRAIADQFREDLAYWGKGTGSCGFTILFERPLSGSAPEIGVKVSGGFVRLEAAPSAYDALASAVDGTKHRIEAPEGALEQFPTVEGNVDYLTRLGASGWAWLPQEPSAAVTVEALLDGKRIGSAVAGELREDLAHWGKGTGRYGFTLTFEAEITGPNAPTFEVTLPQEVAVLPAPPLPALPETNYSARPSVTGSVDRMTRWEVEGWAWMPDHPTQALEVRAVLDGIVIGRAIANQFRQDLADYGLGNGRYGYNIQFDSPVIGNTAPVIEPCLPLHQTLPGLTSLPSISREDLATRPRGDIETLLREHESFTAAGPHFEEFDPGILEQARDHLSTNQPPWVIAFYLPQFHAIAENDKFWGQGFTEWRQLPRGISRFPGHYQPRTPRDLGFYNLLELDSLNQQATLAQAAGITAFAYYYYWFNGNRVLEKPLEVLLNSESDVPFMIIWANENWTRTWDGSESSVLLQQDYRESDDEALVADLARHFTDRRYLRIQTRPLFVIYNPVNIPNASKIIEKWRQLLRSRHMLDPLIFMAQTFGARDPREFGLDGAIEFPPHKLSNNLPGRKTPDAYSPSFTGRVIDYEDFVLASTSEPQPEFPLIKTAVPSWDNESRRPNRGLCLEEISPTKFENWLRTLCVKAIKAPVHGQPIVAINAWNEWAEGAYLEPDVYYGAAFLNATARAVTSAVRLLSTAPSRGGVSVILPNFNHEQFIAERIHSVLNQSIRPAEIIFLDDCSSDGSVARAREILEMADIPFRIVLNEENSGCVFRQWVKGIALAQHDLIWVAETDDSVHEDFLLHILPCFEREEVRAAYGHIEYISPDGESLPYLDGYYDDLKDFDWRKSMVLPAYRAFSRDFAIKNVIPNASGLVFRKPLLTPAEQTRLFEYRFAGDWYFYALVLRGGALAYSRPAKSYFRMNASSASRSAFFTDRHLAEHAMIIADLTHLMGVSPTVVAEHAASLAKFIEGRSPEQLEEELVSFAGLDAEPRPMRICIGAHSFEIGGGEVMPLELANELRRIGHHVTYLVVEPPRQEARQIRHRLRSDIPVVYWENIKSDFEGFIKDFGIEIINSHNISLDYRLATQKYIIPIPYVSSLHGGIETVTSIMTAEIYTYLAHNVSTWLFLSEKNVTALRENGIPAGKFKRSFNALPNYDGALIDRLAFRAEHGISADSFVLVQCSRAIDAKGWDIAAEVTALVAKETGRDVRLVLFGDGPMAAKFRDAPSAETDHLVLMGQVNLPIRYFQCFDAAIFPSTFSGETFPLFMLEAFAAGLPVISTDIGEIGHIMGEAGANSPGVVVSHELERDIIVKEMVRELSQLVQNYDVLQKMQDNARATSNRFSIEQLGNLYIDEFRCLQRDRHVGTRDGLREPECRSEDILSRLSLL